MSLWQSVVLFGEAVCATAQQYMGDEAQRQSLLTMFQPLTHPDTEASVDAAVRAYFEQPPAHVAAVNSLDHTQFMHALVIPNVCSIPLRDVLEASSCLGPIQYGWIWLPSLDVAEIANPTHIRAKDGRDYIQQQMSLTPVVATPPSSSVPSMEQLDGIMKSVLGWFPGLQECIGKIVQGA